jgi:hypothetical protein
MVGRPENFQPGAAYQYEVIVYSEDGGTISLGFMDRGVTHYAPAISLPGSLHTVKSQPLILDAEANLSSTDFILMISCSVECYLDEYRVIRLPMRYRVIEKTVHAEGAPSNEWSTVHFSYDGPATNDADHSFFTKTYNDDDLLNVEFSEFRGHAFVSTEGPDGVVTVNYFHQDDQRKGKAYQTIQMTRSFTSTFDTAQTAGWNQDPPLARDEAICR